MPSSVPATCEQLLCRMIGFDTVFAQQSGQPEAELPLVQYLEALAVRWGFAAQRLPVAGHAPNLLIIRQVDPAAPWLLFDSHLDTAGVEGMTIDPFRGQTIDGRIYGRGACDTKGSGAAMLWALRQCAAGAESGEPGANVAILFTVDEEYVKTGARAFVQDQMRALDWKPVGAVVGEPTSLRLVTATNGVVRWRVRTKGVSAHSSDPALGRSAISDMMRVIDAVESRYIPHLDACDCLTGKAQCSINFIRGGAQVNIIPDECEIQVDRRVVPGEDPGQVLPAVERILEDVARSLPGLRVSQHELVIDPPLDPATNGDFAAKVGRVLSGMNVNAEPVGVRYGSDASSYPSRGVPAVVLGPGDIAQAHTADEWLCLEQLDLAVRIYQRLMCQPQQMWT